MKADARHRSIPWCAQGCDVAREQRACAWAAPCTNGRFAVCARTNHRSPGSGLRANGCLRIQQDNITTNYQSSTSGPTPSALRRRMSSNNTPSGSATNAYS